MGIKVEQVTKRFSHADGVTLDTVSMEFDKSEFVCILGPSGCGKTTLLNIIAGLEKATEGKVFVNDQEVRGPGADRTVMFQESGLFPWLNVLDNVMFGMDVAGIPKEERVQKALAYLELVSLTKYKEYYVHQLSGGMKQRVALARALCLDSDVLLMDEPFAALDSHTKSVLRSELVHIWKKTKKTIVFITHSVEEAVFLADRIIVMDSNPGRVRKEYVLPNPREQRNNMEWLCSEIMAEVG